MAATVADAHLDTANDHIAVITLTAAPPRAIQRDDVVGDASALPIADVHDCTVRRNRARGVLIQTRNATVRNCTFEDISGAAIQITCDTGRWWEGMPTRDVTLDQFQDDDTGLDIPEPEPEPDADADGSFYDQYDDLTAAEILPFLRALDLEGLEWVRDRERAGAKRATVVNQVEQLIGEQGGRRPAASTRKKSTAKRTTAKKSTAKRSTAAYRRA